MADYLRELLPSAIAWAEVQAALGARDGRCLTPREKAVARCVGLHRPDLVRIMEVSDIPVPTTPSLGQAAGQIGLLGPGMIALTLSQTIYVRQGHLSVWLLSHELRHVVQQLVGLAVFLPRYLDQVMEYGYDDAPYEQDARAYEIWEWPEESIPGI